LQGCDRMEAVWNGQAHLAQGRSPYARRRPEETLLYQVIDDNYPDFVARFEAQGRTLPRFVRREFICRSAKTFFAIFRSFDEVIQDGSNVV
jgi:hypothetical protein